jgi:uncharacterized membrane protein YfcA
MNYVFYVALGLVAGVVGGMFGLGGGIILIPAMVFLFGLTQHQAQGTSLTMMIAPVTLFAAWRYWQGGNVKWDMAGLMCVGFLIGGLLGAHFVQGVSEAVLKRMFGVYLLLISVKFILAK